MKRNIFITFIILLLCAAVTRAQNPGTTGFQFLRIPVGARQSALAGATSMISDANAIFHNPAAIDEIKSIQIGANHNRWLAGISEQSAAAVFPRGNYLFGLGFKYMHMGDITGYDVDAYGEPVKIDDFTSYDMCAVLSYCKLMGGFSGGLNIKIFQEAIEEESATGFAADIGFKQKFSKNLTLGMVAQNLGAGVQFIEESTPLPLNYKLGLLYKSDKKPFIVAADIEKPADNKMNISVGQEHKVSKFLFIRYGYRYKDDIRTLGILSGINAGFGLTWKTLMLDYAYSTYKKLGDTHKFSLLVRIGTNKPKEK
jgi:long-subunit fatty acid transport protein